MPLLCMVLQECTGRWYSVATSPHAEDAGCQGAGQEVSHAVWLGPIPYLLLALTNEEYLL